MWARGLHHSVNLRTVERIRNRFQWNMENSRQEHRWIYGYFYGVWWTIQITHSINSSLHSPQHRSTTIWDDARMTDSCQLKLVICVIKTSLHEHCIKTVIKFLYLFVLCIPNYLVFYCGVSVLLIQNERMNEWSLKALSSSSFQITAPPGTVPLLVFVNPKSGGKQGTRSVSVGAQLTPEGLKLLIHMWKFHGKVL